MNILDRKRVAQEGIRERLAALETILKNDEHQRVIELRPTCTDMITRTLRSARPLRSG